MARSRNIKPGFFDNDLLAEIPPLGRLLFIGLWTIADRDGRLEDRPKKIKAQVLPYDECDVDSLLEGLASRGFILRYSVSDMGFIQVQNWAKHQQPHIKEVASSIPAPDKHGASTVKVPDNHGTGTEQESLIPDSLNPIPDPVVPPKPPKGGNGKRRRGADALLEMGEISPEAIQFGKAMVQGWKKQDPDGRPIRPNLTEVITRMDGIAKRQPVFTPAVQFQAGMDYLAEPRQRYKAPHYFLSLEADPQTGQPPFKPYCVAVVRAQKPEVPLAIAG